MKSIYAIYAPFAQTMEEPFSRITDMAAKIDFINTVRAQKRNFDQQKINYPIEQLQLVKIVTISEGSKTLNLQPNVDSDVAGGFVTSVIMTGQEALATDEDEVEDEIKVD